MKKLESTYRMFTVTLLTLMTAAAVTAHGLQDSIPLERSRLTDSIAHFVYEISVGDGPYDMIRVHRVVKTKGEGRVHRRWRPVSTEHSVFLIHGSAGLFSTAFLAGSLPSSEGHEQSLAVFLAERDVDVWGVDLSWSLVPFDVEDVSFMAEWGLQRQVEEVSAALDVASAVRARGHRHCRLRHRRHHRHDALHLLGYSLGGPIGYAVVNDEVTRPCWKRRVKGFIPLDTSIRGQNPATTARACEAASATDLQLAGGSYRDTINGLASQVGLLASVDPGGPSPVVPGLTNEQFALFALALPSPPPPGADNPFFHQFAGVFDALTGLPIDLAHVSKPFAFEWLQSFGGGAPLKTGSDAAHLVCGDVDLPFDDALHEVEIPVRYMGADGGFGSSGIFSTTLLGSSDVTSEVVDIDPNDALDFGHIDLATASPASFLVWESLADWIREHDGGACQAGSR